VLFNNFKLHPELVLAAQYKSKAALFDLFNVTFRRGALPRSTTAEINTNRNYCYNMHVPELVWLPIIVLPPANYIMINCIMANANNSVWTILFLVV